MKRLFTLSLLLFTLSLPAQITGESYIMVNGLDTVRKTSWYNLENSSTILLSFRITKLNSDFTLELKYHFGADQRFKVAKGDSIWLKFDNGASLTLFSLDSAISRKAGATYEGSVKGLITPGVHVKYRISTGAVISLTYSKIEKIRIFSSRGFDNLVLNRRQQELIQDVAKYILSPTVYKFKGEEKKEIPEEQKDEKW